MIFIVLGSSILGSCSSSVIYEFYTGHVYNQDVFILFCKADSTYVYSNSLHSRGPFAKEIGEYKTIRDTIFLYPQFDLIRKNKPPHICRIYDCCKSGYTTIDNDTAVEKFIYKKQININDIMENKEYLRELIIILNKDYKISYRIIESEIGIKKDKLRRMII